MTKSKTTTSFRFDDDFIDLLDTWSFVSKKEKGELLQEAFLDYVKKSELATKVNKVSAILQGD